MSRFKYLMKILLGREIYVRPDVKVDMKWMGNVNAGFYVMEKGINSNSIIYSFGVGEDISFDEALINKYQCNVYGFDPTPKSIKYIEGKKNLSANYHFEPYGIYSYDGTITFLLPENPDHVSCTAENIVKSKHGRVNKVEVPVLKFSTIVNKLGHQKIDIVKLDIEGSEYEVLKDILNSDVQIDQICIEFHHRFKGISKKKTKDAIKLLRGKGYKLAAISDQAEEYTFLKIISTF